MADFGFPFQASCCDFGGLFDSCTRKLIIAKGTGFAQATKKGSDTSSEVMQKVFQRVCLEDPKLIAEFLNKVFNNLNWAITEFGVCAKEVLSCRSMLNFKLQNALQSHFVAELQQFQRKCTVMFELSVTLARVSNHWSCVD